MKTNIFRTVMVIAIGAVIAIGFGGCPNETTKVAVSGVKLDKDRIVLPTGGTAKLTATVTPSDAKNKAVTWVSDDPAVATVDQNGNVTAVAVGATTITVTTKDGGLRTGCPVTVKDAPESIRVDATGLAKTWYVVGDDPSSLDITGLVISAVFDNGNNDEVITDMDAVTVSELDTANPGEKTITVTYLGKEATFTVTVYAVTSIEVTKKPDKTRFAVGVDMVEDDLHGIEVKAAYGDNFITETVPITLADNITYDFKKTGDKVPVTVTYRGVETAFTVIVAEVSEIIINGTPDKTRYAVGEEIQEGDISGLLFSAKYSDNFTESINIILDDLSYDFTATGIEVPVTVTYGGKENTFNVTVYALSSIAVTSPPEKTRYGIGEKPLELTGLVVTPTYTDGLNIPVITVTAEHISGFDTSEVGEKTITVRYGGKEDSFTVTVYATVTFDLGRGTWARETNTEESAGDPVEKPEDPARTGYTFDDWFTHAEGGTVFDFTKHIIENTTVYAQWNCTVIFNPNNGNWNGSTDPQPVQVKENTVIPVNKRPGTPTRTNYTFDGWYTKSEDGEKFDIATKPVTAAITLYAQWNCTVTFNPNGGTLDGSTANKTVTVRENTPVTNPGTPARTGFAFDGWYTEKEDGEKFDIATTKITAVTTLYARWTITVTFNPNGGKWGNDTNNKTVVVVDGTVIPAGDRPATPALDDCTFDGWFEAATGGEAVDLATTKITAGKTLYAQWSCKVTFNTYGGSAVNPVTVKRNTAFPEPANPTLDGCTFAGWFAADTGGTPLTFPLNITGDRTLHAQWNVTVTFNSNGGSTVSPVTQRRGTNFAAPANPTLTNCTFDGWFTAETNGTKYDFPLTVTAHTTVHAQWSCTVTFIANGGTLATGTTPQIVKRNSTASRPANDPTREGCYAFDDWYTAASGGTVFNFGNNITVHTTVYAQWVDDHDYDNWIETTAPTCSARGVETGTCSRDQNHKDTRPGAAIVPTAHNYGDWEVTTAASATASKIEMEICSHNHEHIRGMRLTDSRDGGRIYKIVKINNQTWMAENLDYAAEGSIYYQNNEAANKKYGRLYNWATAMNNAPSSAANPSGVQGIAPLGWHIPSDAEWDVLIAFVHSDNGLASYTGGTSDLAGKYLKAESGWNSYSGIVNDDKYGFSALPGADGPLFTSVGDYGYWWSSTQANGGDARFRYMVYRYEGVYRDSNNKSRLFSVRCVMD